MHVLFLCFVFKYTYVVYHIYWLVYVQPSLHFMDKVNLVLMDNLLNILFYILFANIFEHFWDHFHQGCSLKFSFACSLTNLSFGFLFCFAFLFFLEQTGFLFSFLPSVLPLPPLLETLNRLTFTVWYISVVNLSGPGQFFSWRDFITISFSIFMGEFTLLASWFNFWVV